MVARQYWNPWRAPARMSSASIGEFQSRKHDVEQAIAWPSKAIWIRASCLGQKTESSQGHERYWNRPARRDTSWISGMGFFRPRLLKALARLSNLDRVTGTRHQENESRDPSLQPWRSRNAARRKTFPLPALFGS